MIGSAKLFISNKLMPLKEDFQWHLNYAINSINQSVEKYSNCDNSTHLKFVLDNIRVKKVVNVSLFVVACLVSFFCAVLSFKLLLILFQYTKGVDSFWIFVITLFLSLLFLTLGLVSFIHSIKLLNFRDFCELENRLNSLLQKKDIESFSIEEIESYLSIRVSEWAEWDVPVNELLKNSSYSNYIKEPVLFNKILQLFNDFPDLGGEQYNRIGSYVFRCEVVVIPIECKSQRQKVEFWMSINGGKGALGSLTLIDKPYYSKDKTNNTQTIKNLLELKKLFKDIGFEDGIRKIEEDLSLISKRPK